MNRFKITCYVGALLLAVVAVVIAVSELMEL